MECPITRYRAAKHLSQTDFAAKVGRARGWPLRQTIVSRWERGEVAVSTGNAIAIEKATRGGVTQAQLRAWAKHIKARPQNEAAE